MCIYDNEIKSWRCINFFFFFFFEREKFNLSQDRFNGEKAEKVI